MDTQMAENISINDAVRTFGIGRTKLYELIRNGDIEAVKLGRRTLIRTASAREFIDSLPRAGSVQC